MAEFDYSADIASLKGNYFNNPNMSPRGREGLRNNILNKVVPLLEMNDQLDQRAAERRRSELAYEAQAFNLQQARDQRQAELEAMTRVPEITAELENAFKDPNKSVFDKSKELSRIQAKYVPNIAASPALGSIFSGYADRLSIEENERAAAATASAQARADKMLRANAFIQEGLVGEAKKVFEEDGLLDDEEAKNLHMAKRVTGARNKKVAKDETTAANIAAQNSFLKARDEQVTGFGKFLDSIGAAKSSKAELEDGDIPSTYGGKSKGAAAPAVKAPFELDFVDKTTLLTGLVALHGVPVEALKDIPDEKLYELARQKQFALAATPSTSTTAPNFDR